MEGRPCAPLVAAAAQGAGEGAAAGVVACGAGGVACHRRGASAGGGAAACAVGVAGVGGRDMEGSRGAGAWELGSYDQLSMALGVPKGLGFVLSLIT